MARRNWVIGRMLEEGYIDELAAENAKAQPLKVVKRDSGFVKHAEYFSEEVRRGIERRFGAEALNEGGLIVRTTVDPRLQEIATRVFREKLQEYDRRHGWRGQRPTSLLKTIICRYWKNGTAGRSRKRLGKGGGDPGQQCAGGD